MNGKRYMKVLEDKLFPLMERLGATKFPQDGAPCHTSKKVMAQLKEKQISVMDWPGNSPDLNPIENLWAIMKTGSRGSQILRPCWSWSEPSR
jgi:transposase